MAEQSGDGGQADHEVTDILPERLALGGTICVVALAFWALIQPQPPQFVLIALVMAPLIAMQLAVTLSRSLRLLAGTYDERSNLMLAYAVPGVVLALYAFLNISPVSWFAALAVGAAVALAIGVAGVLTDRRGPFRSEAAVLLVLLSLPYGYGATQVLNFMLDMGAPRSIPAEVQAKQTYWFGVEFRQLLLGPWGPRSEPRLVRAEPAVYDSVVPGDIACVSVRSGAFRLFYMTLESTCPADVDASIAAGSVRAGKLGLGIASFERNDYVTALWALKKPANDGEPDALFFLGLMYGDGKGVKLDHREAMRLWRLAAAQHHGRALNVLGYSYDHGIGVNYDPALAVSWYRKAVAVNEPRAMNNLANLYRTARGVPRDLVEARRLLLDAVKLDYAPAMGNLGTMYATGTGVGVDMAKAAEWWRRSVALGDDLSAWYLGHHLVREDATAAELSEGLEMLERAAVAGSGEAAVVLSLLHRQGRGVPKGWSQQIKWLDHAVKLEHPPAILLRGALYLEQQQPAEAIPMYRKAADMGYARAQAHLGRHYLDGNGVPKDAAEAMQLFRKAAIQGDALGQRELAYMFDAGLGTDRNPREAARLYRLAARQGDAYSAGNLALMYLNASGIPQDMAEAYKWTKIAAEHNQPEAINSLAVMLDRGTFIGRDVTAAIDLYRRAAAFGQPNAAHSLAAHSFTGRSTPRDIGDAYYWMLIADRLYDPAGRQRMARLKQAILAALPGAQVDRVSVERRAARFTPLPPPVAELPPEKPYVAPRRRYRN